MESCRRYRAGSASGELILNAGHAIDPALLKDTTLSRQSLITRHLAAIVKRLDTSRVVPPL